MRAFYKSIIAFIGLCIIGVSLPACDTVDKNGNVVNPIENYTVTFVENGGSSVSDKKVKVLMEAPYTYRTNYLFDAWYLDRNLTNEVKFPLELSYDVTLYAKWLKLVDQKRCTNVVLKMWAGNDPIATWTITPSAEFDLGKLAEKGYYMQITVTYDVYYEKDYDVPFDIGYAGAPKYEVSIAKENLLGKHESDLPTTKEAVRKSITYTQYINDLIGEKLMLSFSTDNIQNLVYFKNIVVDYKCLK